MNRTSKTVARELAAAQRVVDRRPTADAVFKVIELRRELAALQRTDGRPVLHRLAEIIK